MRIPLLCLSIALLAGGTRAGDNWPEFRGPTADGQARATNLALTWSETKNVRWKTAIHDRGWSSPVVWGKQVWVTTATRDGTRLFAVCVDRDTGKVTHDVKVFDVSKPETISKLNSYASPTPAIEPGRVYVHFGTCGTACLATDSGKVLWTRRDLNCDHHMGPGASPILCGDLLIFPMDGCDVQYVVALDKATGRTVWKTDRSVDYRQVHRYTRKAFATPAIITVAGRKQLIAPCSRAVIAYDVRTGKELWKVRHPGWSMVARPLFGGGVLFVVIDYDHPQLWAIRPDGTGDVTGTHVVWKIPRGKRIPANASQILIGERLFMVSEKGTASCVEAATGRFVWRQRLGGQYWSSPIAVAGRIYFFRYDGLCTVIAPGEEFKQLAANRLDGRMMASPAVAGEALFPRTETHLYRIEN